MTRKCSIKKKNPHLRIRKPGNTFRQTDNKTKVECLKDQYLKLVVILSSKVKVIHPLLKGNPKMIKKKKKMRCLQHNIGSKQLTQ
jgi:hypothetical protein